MKFAPFLLSAQIYCAFVAALQYGFMPDEHDTSKLMEKEHLVSLNGRRVGTGDKRHAWKHHHSLMEEHSEHSEDSNNEEKWKWLEKRGDVVEPLLRERALQARAAGLEVAGVTMEEEHVLALVIEKDQLDNCNDELETYCNGLGGVKKDLEDVYSLVGTICKTPNKCPKNKGQIEAKCTDFQATLKRKVDTQLNTLSDDDCKEFETKCFIGEKAKPTDKDLKEKCNKLRNECYKRKREKAANEILMRVLRGDLDDTKECTATLEAKCPLLINGSQELLEKCAKPEETCESLKVKVKEKCDTLKEALEKGKNDLSNMTCPPLLKDCYFYKDSCENHNENVKEECKQLEKQCKEKQYYLYKPPGFPFNPIEPEDELVKADADDFYKEAELSGVIIKGIRDMVDATYLLGLAVPPSNRHNSPGKFEKDCQAKLGDNCNYYKTLFPGMNEWCKNEDKAKKCKELEDEIGKKCGQLKKTLTDKKLYEKTKTLKGWYDLDSIVLYEEECRTLQAKCQYMAIHCNGNNEIKFGCPNLRAKCYKMALEKAAKERLENQLRGEFRNATLGSGSKKTKELLEKGKGLGSQMVEVFAWLLYPTKTWDNLVIDMNDKIHELLHDLNRKRDVPDEKTCLYYPKRGEILKQDQPDLLTKPLKALDENCRFLDLAKDLKNKFEKGGVFKDLKSCMDWLSEKHPTWMRRRHKDLSWLGYFSEKTCQIITTRVEENCENFKLNLDKYSEDFSKETPAEECELWQHYCGKLSSHCNNKRNEFKKKCVSIQGNCTFILEKRRVENEIMVELAGSLTNGTEKCKNYMDRLCVMWKNGTWNNGTNTTRESLCVKKSDDEDDDSDEEEKKEKDNNQVKIEVCNRLVERVEEICITLKTTLPAAQKVLEGKKDKYDELKNDAIKMLNKTALQLLRKTDQISTRLVKRSDKFHMIDVEAKALDLVSWAMELYFELEEECKTLKRDCKFREECSKYGVHCEEIDKICSDLDPLKVDIPGTPIVPEKPEEKPKEEGKTTSTSEGGKVCESVSTKDVWVTQTVTHTHTTTSTQTQTSKVTVTSTRKCKPTQCTTDKGGHTGGGGGDEKEEVVPSEGSIVWVPKVGWVLVLVSVVAVWV